MEFIPFLAIEVFDLYIRCAAKTAGVGIRTVSRMIRGVVFVAAETGIAAFGFVDLDIGLLVVIVIQMVGNDVCSVAVGAGGRSTTLGFVRIGRVTNIVAILTADSTFGCADLNIDAGTVTAHAAALLVADGAGSPVVSVIEQSAPVMQHLIDFDIALAAVFADARIGTVGGVVVLGAFHIVTLGAACPMLGIIPLSGQSMVGDVSLFAAEAAFLPVLRAVVLGHGVGVHQPRDCYTGSVTVDTDLGGVAGSVVQAELVDGLAAFRAGKPAFGLGVDAGVDVHLAGGAPGRVHCVFECAQSVFDGGIAADRAAVIDKEMLFDGADVRDSAAIGAGFPVGSGVVGDLRGGCVSGGIIVVEFSTACVADVGIKTCGTMLFCVQKGIADAADVAMLIVCLNHGAGILRMRTGLGLLVIADRADALSVEGVVSGDGGVAGSAVPPVAGGIRLCVCDVVVSAGGVEDFKGMIGFTANAAASTILTDRRRCAVAGGVPGDGFLFAAQ